MKLKLLITTSFCLLLSISESYADKSYNYVYDANGNRINVSYVSSCRMRDTTQVDTIPQDVLKEIKTVSTPSVYPNPMREYFTLSFPDLSNLATIEIYDLNGGLVYKNDQINTTHTIIKSCELAAGLYTVVVYYGSDKPYIIKIEKF